MNCNYKEMSISNETNAENSSNSTTPINIEKSLIVLSAPSVDDEYYSSKFVETIDYMANFANLVIGKNEIVILADAQTLPHFKGKVPSNILIEAVIDDIWIRDYGPVIPSKQIKFKFSPAYAPTAQSMETDKTFDKWFNKYGLKYHAKSDIILDGGNVVDNVAATRVVLTDRILQDNPSLTKSTAKDILKQLLGVNEVAIIPSPSDDTTAHADGFVMWPMDDKIFLAKIPEPMHTETVNELKSSFPGVQIVEIHDYTSKTIWRNFTSARNCFVNCIVTDDYIYMPTFNDEHDAEMIHLFQFHTNKTVVPVPSENVAIMGGSVRCLSWQVQKENMNKILQQIKRLTKWLFTKK